MIKQLLTTAFVSLALAPPALASWPASEADSFPTPLDREVARRPHVQVPESSSVKQACEIYFAQSSVHSSADDYYTPKILNEAKRWSYGEITKEEYHAITRSWELKVAHARARWSAAGVGVLRAAGYNDWKMYSRYDIAGIGDLWRSNVISGDKLGPLDKNHPDFKYTSWSLWLGDVHDICKRYK